MSYTKRFVTLFRRPSESVQEIVKYPCFFKTSLVIILCGLGYIIIAELALFRSLMPHFIAAYALMFTIIWLLPTVLSLVFFKIIGKRFNTESYLEASALSIFSVLTIGFIFLSLFMIYSNLFAEPKRTAYFAMVYYNQWYPLAIIGGIGVVLLFHRIIIISRSIVKAKLYQILSVWVAAAVISVYVAYLFFRGWL
jgi:hypothetical protein